MRRVLLRTGQVGVATLAGLAVLAGASGWLYLIQPSGRVPGPSIADALPLDELSRRSAVPLLVFVAVWSVAAALLGLIARLVGVGRLAAALSLLLGVGGLTYLTTGASIAVVRQVPASMVAHAAAHNSAVYLAAALAGLGGAVLGRRRRHAVGAAPLVLALLVAAAGGLDIFVAVFPESGPTAFEQLAPHAVAGIASALVAPIGVSLIVLARGLARRKRRAAQLAIALLGGSAALQLGHGRGFSACAVTVVALALTGARDMFTVRGDRSRNARLVRLAALVLAVQYAYAAAALLANHLVTGVALTPLDVFGTTTEAMLGLDLGGAARLGRWFPLTVFFFGLAAAAPLLAGWLAPWRFRLTKELPERELARRCVQSWGTDTLAPFALREDKAYFFNAAGTAFLAYRVVGGIAIVSGDPIGPESEFDDLLRRFKAHAHERDWRIAILGASPAHLGLYRAHGLHSVYHGDEAVVDVASFSLEGRAIRKVRQSVNRLEKAGYRSETLSQREIRPELRMELEAIARVWRGADPERGFAMALDTLFGGQADQSVFVIGRGPAGRPEGFIHFAVSQPGKALSLSSMPRLSGTPNGFNEWLVCTAVEWSRAHGFQRVSLNFAPFAALFSPEARLSRVERMQRRILLGLKGRFQLDNLLVFNRKFFPSWQQRFVVYEHRRDLPRVAIAALAAEAYLPFSGRQRR